MRRRAVRQAERLKLYGSNTTLGYNVVRLVTPVEGQQLELQRKARRVEDEAGKLLGWVLASGVRSVTAGNRTSSAAFSRKELEAIAGLKGESQTRGLSDGDRAERTKVGLPAVDLIEAAQDKLQAYPAVH